MSPSLFAAFIGDIEEMFRKGQAGGAVVGKEKVWSLVYADDLVVLAREEKGMKEMLGSIEKYMRRKKLTVNVEKSKMMVFRKERNRRWGMEREGGIFRKKRVCRRGDRKNAREGQSNDRRIGAER
jgi:hypothetical protein